MTPERFDDLTGRFSALRVGIVGDFSLDRYFDIDPSRAEVSIETGLPVHNVSRVRCSPGAAGNIAQNIAAFRVGEVWPVGYCGDDGEGFELLRALRRLPALRLDHFRETPERVTFNYSKPLLQRAGKAPEELSRLDIKNWTPTPPKVEAALVASLNALAPRLDALIVMDQSAVPGAGVINPQVLAAVQAISARQPRLTIVADSRHGLGGFPPLVFKMNLHEFITLTRSTGKAPEISDAASPAAIGKLQDAAVKFAAANGRAVFITLAEHGIVGATPAGDARHVKALPVRGEIDIVGAGDTVTAALTLALAAGAEIEEAMLLAQAAASIVVHQLGTTGVASLPGLRTLLFS